MAKLPMVHASRLGQKRLNDGNNNGQLRIANATSGGARKAAWAKILLTWEKIKSKGRNWQFLKPTGCCISNIWLD